MKLSRLLFSFSLFSFSLLNAQTPEILNVFANGSNAKQGTSGTWQLDWTTGSNTTVYRTVFITYTKQTNNSDKLVVDASNTSSGWEVQIGNVGSNSWHNICKEKTVKVNNRQNGDTITESVELRYTGSSTGALTNTLTFGFGDCNSYTGLANLEVGINNISGNLYTWTGRSGIDSFYTTATNWSPTRTSPSNSDVLVVDLATLGNPIQTTIDISGVTQTIGQFIIYANNHVTFKCTTDAKWTVGNGITGTDFIQQNSTSIRKTGAGELEIIVPANNSLDIDGSITTVAGDLLFSGAGTHNISGNIKTVGGLLNFTPSSGTNTLFLDGTKQVLSGNSYVSGTPTLYIDTNFNVTVGTAATSPIDTLTLQRTLPIYSVVTLRPGTRIISNNPASSSESDWNAWEPYFQLKAPQFNQAVKRGQLNVVPTSSEIVGGSQFEIYGTNVRAYRMIGLPFANGVHLSQFSDDIDLTGVVTNSANKDSFETNCSVCKTSAFHWNEGTGAWNGYSSGATATILPKGKGTLVFFRGRKNNGLGDTSAAANEGIIDFKGKLQVGDYTYTLSKSGTAGTSLDGFNLVANPYPCNITFDEVYSKHKGRVKPRFRTYDARRKTYNIWDSAAPTAVDRRGAKKFTTARNQQAKVIAPGAAFFVEAENNQTLVIDFKESMKVPFDTAQTSQHGVQEIQETACNDLSINLSYDNDTALESDNVKIRFDLDYPNITHAATSTDVPVFYAGYLGIGTLSPEGTWLTIDRRPKIALPKETYTIPLKTVYPKDALKDLILDFNFCSDKQSNYRVQLLDKVKNTSTEVTDLASYHYQINTTEDKKENRFELVFTGIDQNSNTQILEQNKFVVFPNPSNDGQIYVANSQNQTVETISIKNQLGQTVKQWQLNQASSLVPINVQELPAGIYVLQISQPHNIENHSIIIK